MKSKMVLDSSQYSNVLVLFRWERVVELVCAPNGTHRWLARLASHPIFLPLDLRPSYLCSLNFGLHIHRSSSRASTSTVMDANVHMPPGTP
jgi:hypothetical protein